MAHEIKNPLTAIQTFAGFIPEKHKDPEFAKKLQEVLTAEAKRMQELVQELLTFAKPKTPQLKPVDLAPLISSTITLLSSDLSKRRIQWSVDCNHNGATIHADPDQLRQVLINLIQNAADAMPNGGQLKIAIQAVNRHLELTVSDTGSGIPPALLPKIFDPFVTTKPDGNGLGLAMVYSILQAHHGTIRANSPNPPARRRFSGGRHHLHREPAVMRIALLKAFQKLPWREDVDLSERMQHQEVLVSRNKGVCASRCSGFKKNVVLRVPASPDAPARNHKTSLSLHIPCDRLPFTRRYVRFQRWAGSDPEEFLDQPWGGNQMEPLITEGFKHGPCYTTP